jgi:hypothetical protein
MEITWNTVRVYVYPHGRESCIESLKRRASADETRPVHGKVCAAVKDGTLLIAFGPKGETHRDILSRAQNDVGLHVPFSALEWTGGGLWEAQADGPLIYDSSATLGGRLTREIQAVALEELRRLL